MTTTKTNKKKLACIQSYHKVALELFKVLADLYDLEVITTGKIPEKHYKTTNFKPRYIFRNFFYYYPGLYRHLKKNKYDVVSISPYFRPYALSAILYTIVYKKELFFIEEQRNDPHGKLDNFFFQLWLVLVRPLINAKAKRIICITKPCQSYLKKKRFKNLEYIPISYKPLIKEAQVKNNQEDLKIIVVARFDWLKAHDVLIKAVDYIIKTGAIDRSQIKIDLVSDKGNLKKQTENMVRNLGLSDIFNFVGFVDDLDACYRDHNLFILPSRSETVGMVVYEAMSNGLPIIVSDHVGSSGSVYPRKNGYVFRSDDYKDLAKAIISLKDKEIRNKYGKESIKILNEEHKFELIKEKYVNALK